MRNFDEWNKVKKKIDSRDLIDIEAGSIWLCNYGINVGYEIDGKDSKFLRPSLVLLSFGMGGGIVLPLTTSNKKSKFLVKITKNSSVNLTQVKYFDSRRFYKKMGYLNKTKLDFVTGLFVGLFCNENNSH